MSRTHRAQVEPIKQKLTRQQQEHRNLNIAMRRDHAIHRGVTAATVGILRRGFLGRLKWLLRGA